ncbi:site-2 protease family protein [soil metagenome]
MENFSLFDFLSWYIVFIYSMVLHEASHAYASWKLGDSTAYDQGQVSLDPTPHVKREPFGMVLVPIASFLSAGWMLGWASAPYDPHWAARYPKKSAIMAAAGPAANLAICLGSFILIKAGLATGLFTFASYWDMSHVVISQVKDWTYVAAQLLSIAFTLNFILMLFNLLPVPPLDGSAIVKLFLPESACKAYDDFLRSPGLPLVGLLVAWYVFPYFGRPALRWAVMLV